MDDRHVFDYGIHSFTRLGRLNRRRRTRGIDLNFFPKDLLYTRRYVCTFVNASDLLRARSIYRFVRDRIPRGHVGIRMFLLFKHGSGLSSERRGLIRLDLRKIARLRATYAFRHVCPLIIQRISNGNLTSHIAITNVMRYVVRVRIKQNAQRGNFVFQQAKRLFLGNQGRNCRLNRFLTTNFVLRRSGQLMQDLNFARLVVMDFGESYRRIGLTILRIRPYRIANRVVVDLRYFSALFGMNFRTQILYRYRHFLRRDASAFCFQNVNFVVPCTL